jgi:hypothetical protein
MPAELAQGLEARHSGHREVQQDHVRLEDRRHVEAPLRVRGRADLVAELNQDLHQGRRDLLVILDEKDAAAGRGEAMEAARTSSVSRMVRMAAR